MMTLLRHTSKFFSAFVLLMFLAPVPAHAQLQTGNLFAAIRDQQDQALAGVIVTVTGYGEPQVQVSDSQGQVRFLDLGPGSYSMKAELEGFSTVDYPNIVIDVGRNTSVEVTMSPAVTDVISVGEPNDSSEPNTNGGPSKE